jgi:glycosyltransferase involved in cell wall biosynthesis
VTREPQAASNHPRPVLLLVVNVAWYFRLHRLALAKAASDDGFDVHVATAPDTPADAEEIKRAGLVYHPIKIRRGRWRPLEDLRLAWQLYRIQRQLAPDVVHHITIKPVMFGTLAARLAGAPAIVNAMSGLGFVFTAVGGVASMRRAAVMLAYRALFASSKVRVIFENRDDMSLFVEKKFVPPSQATVVRGVGVDARRFQGRQERGAVPLIVLPGRMLWDKGVREFCAAAAMLRAEGVQASFALVGPLDPENPAAIPQSWLDEQSRGSGVEWWGHRSDMSAVYAQASIVCLPSYREGLPTVLVEGAASNCAIVATDVPGCREVIVHGETGLLVSPRDAGSLAEALRKAITDPVLRFRLAAAAYAFVTAELSEERITSGTIRIYREMMAARLPSF